MKASIRLGTFGLILSTGLANWGMPSDLRVKGNRYPEAVQVAGKTLRLLGAGLRERWLLDVYTLGAYSESGTCGAEALISTEEVKYLRIDLLREVPASRMVDALGKAFRRNLPPERTPLLDAQVKDFLAYFEQDLAQGTRIEFTYVPGVGTTLSRDGKQEGPATPGRQFAALLWSCYFSSRTCCPSLKAQVLFHCSK